MAEIQLDLFSEIPRNGWECSPKKARYWREELRDALGDAFEWRHACNTTGWSVAEQTISFAPKVLYMGGHMRLSEYRRWWRFKRRMQAWFINEKHH